ncbi:unnamed protein product [Spodoptera exigua]|nr:unnamed protein product [Spodoptera exigua]
MLVLFLSFAVLRISVSLNQLQRSLSHVNDMLADIEGKIESERKFLTRLDYDVNFKDEPRFMEYPTTDIWWEDFRLPLPGTTKQQAETTRILSVRQAVLNTTVSDNQRPNLTTRITLIASAKSPNLSAQITTTTAHSESHDPLIRGIVKKWVRQSNHSQSLVSKSDIPNTVPVYTSSTPSVFMTTEDMALDMTHPPNWPFPNNSAVSRHTSSVAAPPTSQRRTEFSNITERFLKVEE